MSAPVVALVDDLMDRSRLDALGKIHWATDAEAAAALATDTGTDTVLVDIARYGSQIRALRDLAPALFIVAFGSHVDATALADARSAGADRVLPRSRFFADPAAALAPDGGSARA